MDRTEPAPRAPRPLLRAADQSTVALLVGICLSAILLHGCWLRVFRQQRLDFDRAPPLQIDFQIDINAADWPEFTLLPGIGAGRLRETGQSGMTWQARFGRFEAECLSESQDAGIRKEVCRHASQEVSCLRGSFRGRDRSETA